MRRSLTTGTSAAQARLPDPDQVARNVAEALREDIGSGDLSAPLLSGCPHCKAVVVSRESAVLCGQPWFGESFRQVDPEARVEWLCDEGSLMAAGDTVCAVSGAPASLLAAERTALNFLQMLSAAATLAHRCVSAAGGGALVVDTRKTLPGLRHAQKYATRAGGAVNHRMGLYDRILLKENHLIAGGGLGAVLLRAREQGELDGLQIEVRSLDELRSALDLGARQILLDNFAPAEVREAAGIAAAFAGAELEASGGITLDNIADYAHSGVARLSVGALTKNVAAVEFSMKIEENVAGD